jgi:hypothetical protein
MGVILDQTIFLFSPDARAINAHHYQAQPRAAHNSHQAPGWPDRTAGRRHVRCRSLHGRIHGLAGACRRQIPDVPIG